MGTYWRIKLNEIRTCVCTCLFYGWGWCCNVKELNLVVDDRIINSYELLCASLCAKKDVPSESGWPLTFRKKILVQNAAKSRFKHLTSPRKNTSTEIDPAIFLTELTSHSQISWRDVIHQSSPKLNLTGN